MSSTAARSTFYAVYILEAHPTDVWQMKSNVKDNVLFATPKSEEEREFVAGACVRKLGIKFPAVIDGIDNVYRKGLHGLAGPAVPDRQRRQSAVQEQAWAIWVPSGRFGGGD